ncbi:glycosidase [Candidatus Bipolaricaulota bacterium]|nr:glycosidase [Candidatus Bipolaricaulota bacterium]
MKKLFNRVSDVPILTPDPTSNWECVNVFNPAVIYHRGLFHMLYRAQGGDFVSRLGYAVSEDGIHWNRLRQPVFVPEEPREAWGVEDPRIVELEGCFYMTYTAFGPPRNGAILAGGTITPMLARSQNLITWERIGPLVEDQDNKDHVLFPRKIGGYYVALHRPRPAIWLAFSEDLVHWPKDRFRPLFGPRENNWWDNVCVGANGVPVETDYGWLIFYHAYDKNRVYRFGVALLDLDDPSRVISRPKDPVFWPEAIWEVYGTVPNVVFSCANVVVGDTVYLFYGGADHVIGLATAPLKDLLDYVRYHE